MKGELWSIQWNYYHLLQDLTGSGIVYGILEVITN